MRTASLLTGVLLATTTTAGAQEATGGTVTVDRPIQALVGAHGYYARPMGEFSNYIRQGFGGAAHGTLLLGNSGGFGLRIDASFMNYGRETVHDQCVGYTCRVRLDVTTTNNIAPSD